MIKRIKQYKFLFEELAKRDFTRKYKRTVLGMAWSILAPLLNLLIMWIIFGKMLGSNVNHYMIYLHSGQLVFSFFSEATSLGMTSLVGNASIFTKVNVPKYLFLFSQNVSTLINFILNLGIYFVFIGFERIPLHLNFFCLIYPIIFLEVFNIGVSLILSALFVFFRDMQYLWGIMTQLIMWLSAIFYTIDSIEFPIRYVFYANPLYLFITYFRLIVINATIPSFQIHFLIFIYALITIMLGAWMYRRYNTEFLYYV